MQVHVIMLNDSPERAVVEDPAKGIDLDTAKQRLATLRDEHFERNQRQYGSREEYDSRCHWHIRSVTGE